MTSEEQGELLQFVTSCPRQPLRGFGQLNPLICVQVTYRHIYDTSINQHTYYLSCLIYLPLSMFIYLSHYLSLSTILSLSIYLIPSLAIYLSIYN